MPLSAADILIPLVVSLAVLLLARLPWPAASRSTTWAIPVAVGAGWASTFKQVNGAWPSLPPNSAIGWIFYVAIAGMVVAIADALIQPARYIRWIGLPVLLLMSYSLMLVRPLSDTQTRGEAMVWIATFTIVTTLWIAMLRSGPPPRSEHDAGFAMLILASVTAVIWVMSYTWIYARLVIALSVATTPIAILFFFRKRPTRQDGSAVFAIILGGILLCGRFFSEISPTSLALVGLAPLLFGLGKLLTRRSTRMKSSIISLSLLLLPLLLAVGLIAPGYIRSLDEPTGVYGY